jgi:hypothetical protein
VTGVAFARSVNSASEIAAVTGKNMWSIGRDRMFRSP